MKRDEFDKNISQFLEVLKKILKNNPGASQLMNFLDHKGADKINLNLCFFNFLPITPDEMDELEDAYNDVLDSEQDSDAQQASTSDYGWSQSDVDFLKRHGIGF